MDRLVCLNPCFNGRYSQRVYSSSILLSPTRLNPCFNGRYSQSKEEIEKGKITSVLILVLMEDTLRDGNRILDAAGNPVS